MDVIVRGKHLDVPEHIEERVRAKLSKLAHYLPLLEDAAVEVDLAHEKAKEPGLRYIAHVTVSARGVHLQAEERAAKLETVIDQAAKVLARQAQRQKQLLYERGRDRSAKERTLPAAETEEPPSPDRLGRVKHLPLKPMSLHEALEQMNALGHTFFVFQDADADQVAVLYRRRDGDFGLIVPELP